MSLSPEAEAKARALLAQQTGQMPAVKTPAEIKAEEAARRRQQEVAQRQAEADAQRRLDEKRRADQAAKTVVPAATVETAPVVTKTAPPVAVPKTVATTSGLDASAEARARLLLEQNYAKPASAPLSAEEARAHAQVEKERLAAEKRATEEAKLRQQQEAKKQAELAQQKAAADAAAARAAKAQQAAVQQSNGQAAKTTVVKTTSAAPAKPATPSRTASGPGKPLPTEPTGKQGRLAALLDAYKKDQIDSVKYHQERAKIIAEP